MVKNQDRRIEAFVQLGKALEQIEAPQHQDLLTRVTNENPWFTRDNILLAIHGIQVFLQKESLTNWCAAYPMPKVSKNVGMVMAGNIPLVGFHDMLCVLIAGHRLLMKPSSKDALLPKFLVNLLLEIEPDFEDQIEICERLNHCEMIIATGSDNSARYFDYYFKDIPRLIRKNRSSAAIIEGDEPLEALSLLGKDVFSYFGLGCRNVSKLYVPEDYDFSHLLAAWKNYASVVNHHKYANNYDYRKAIFLVGQVPFIDGQFVLLTADHSTVSPLAVLHYQTYANVDELHELIAQNDKKRQCLASANGWYQNSIAFGKTQQPTLNDYADGIDTMAFLTE